MCVFSACLDLPEPSAGLSEAQHRPARNHHSSQSCTGRQHIPAHDFHVLTATVFLAAAGPPVQSAASHEYPAATPWGPGVPVSRAAALPAAAAGGLWFIIRVPVQLSPGPSGALSNPTGGWVRLAEWPLCEHPSLQSMQASKLWCAWFFPRSGLQQNVLACNACRKLLVWVLLSD